MEREKWGNGRGRGFFLCRKSRAKSGAKTCQPTCHWVHMSEKLESRNLSRTQLLLDLTCRIPATFGPLFFLIPEYESEVRMNVPVFTIRTFNSGLSELMAARENLLFTADAAAELHLCPSAAVSPLDGGGRTRSNGKCSKKVAMMDKDLNGNWSNGKCPNWK